MKPISSADVAMGMLSAFVPTAWLFAKAKLCEECGRGYRGAMLTICWGDNTWTFCSNTCAAAWLEDSGHGVLPFMSVHHA